MLVCCAYSERNKSRKLVRDFAIGAACFGARAVKVDETARRLPATGALVTYGVYQATGHLYRQAVAEGREIYYIDNGWWGRGFRYRVARNRLQADPSAAGVRPSFRQLKALGLPPAAPWRATGNHILVCPPGADFMRNRGFTPASNWLNETLRALALLTDRPVVVRRKPHPRGDIEGSLPAALQDCWAVVTHLSNVAVEAIWAGVPAFVDPGHAAAPMANTALADIERPRMPDGRRDWAARLAALQWTRAELRTGCAWATLREIG